MNLLDNFFDITYSFNLENIFLGYTLAESNKCKYQLINECELGTHDCHIDADCTDLREKWTCKCHVGYMGPGEDCEDQNECVLNDLLCGENGVCTNTKGTYNN